MRQYKIWNRIWTVGGRKASCDYGANQTDARDIFIGTGSRNSHPFAEVKTTCEAQDDGALEFSLYVDGTLVKRGIVHKGDYAQTVNKIATL